MHEDDLEQAGLKEAIPTERPWLFGLLIAPNAVLAYGIISGVLSYLLRKQGVGIGRSSEIISLLILPKPSTSSGVPSPTSGCVAGPGSSPELSPPL